MPFLIPACVALAADGLIVYLHRSLLRDEASHSDTLPEESQERGESLLASSNERQVATHGRQKLLLLPSLPSCCLVYLAAP
jgi:hypothetical protein